MGEIIFHVILIAVFALFFKESFEITSGRLADPIGPAGFPQAIIVIILVLSAISLFNTIRKVRQGSEQAEAMHLNKAFFGILGSIALFVVLSEIISFALAAVVFCLMLFYFLGQRTYPKMVLNSIIISTAFVLVFGKILTIPLPRGMGIIKELTYFIY